MDVIPVIDVRHGVAVRAPCAATAPTIGRW